MASDSTTRRSAGERALRAMAETHSAALRAGARNAAAAGEAARRRNEFAAAATNASLDAMRASAGAMWSDGQDRRRRGDPTERAVREFFAAAAAAEASGWAAVGSGLEGAEEVSDAMYDATMDAMAETEEVTDVER